jgi:hypothetical protein
MARVTGSEAAAASNGAVRVRERDASEVALVQVRNLVGQLRQMIGEVDGMGAAVQLVRRSNAAAKLVPEALKACRALEHEQLELRQDVAELHLRTQRKAGELLRELAKHRGGRPGQTGSAVEGVSSPPPRLKELGISPQESHRWQRIASLPGDAFEGYISEGRNHLRELSTQDAVALAGRLMKAGKSDVDLESEPGTKAALVVEFKRIRRHVADLIWLDPVALTAAMEAEERVDVLGDISRMRLWLRELEAALEDRRSGSDASASATVP